MRNNLRFLFNRFLGWSTNQKIIVIESDDWGSIRMPDKSVYNSLLSKGIPVDSSPYCKYDTLESEEDLQALFEVLESVADKHGKHAILTANCIMANPDFQKIKKNNFSTYHFEPVTETFAKYPQHKNSFNLWQEGLRKGVFIPQFHGREHVNVSQWMNSLRENNQQVKIGFDYNFFGFDWPGITKNDYGFMAALDLSNTDDEGFFKDGIKLFETFFKFKPETFIAPAYTWHSRHEEVAKKYGIKIFQGIPFQFVPTTQKKNKKQFHYTGQKNAGLLYTTRNCFFEPTITGKTDVVEICLNRIDQAFKSKKPAVIGSHRLNYIGSINQANRDQNLPLLKKLLQNIVRSHPEVEFMSTADLYRLMINE